MSAEPRGPAGPPPPHAGRRVRGPIPGAVVVLSAALALAGCTGARLAAPPRRHHDGRPASSAAAASTTTTTAAAATATAADTVPAVTVTDTAGQKFVVQTSALPSPLALLIQGWLRSASPGHVYLHESVTVANPTDAPEPLREFDDPTTGLADGLEFVMDASDASPAGFGADCGVDPGYPAQLCPISFPQGVVVDSDSAYTSGPSVTLAPGTKAQIVYSFGPVLSSLDGAEVSLYFSPGVSGPVRLGA